MTPSGPVAAAPPPDGSPGYPEGYVIWQSNRLDAHHDIYRARADGSEVTRLTTAGALLPIWAPDGRWIGFHDDANTGYLMRPDGSELQTLTAGAPWFWLHDNSGLVVLQGGSINLYDVETQESRELISIGDFPQFTGASFVVGSITHDNRYLLLGSSLTILPPLASTSTLRKGSGPSSRWSTCFTRTGPTFWAAVAGRSRPRQAIWCITCAPTARPIPISIG